MHARKVANGRLLCIFSEMPENRVAPNEISFSAGIGAGGEWQMALYLLAEMPAVKLEQTQISFNAGISACEKGGEWQIELYLVSEMPEARVAPNEISYSAGISACEKAGEWQMALYLLLMLVSRVSPDVINVNAGMSACEKAGKWQMALYLLSQMFEARCEPDEISYSAGIAACGRAGLWRTSLSLFEEICALCHCPKLDKASYGQVLQAVWPEPGSLELFARGVEDNAWSGMLRNHGNVLDLHDHPEGSATLALRWWLAEIITKKLDRSRSYEIKTGWGKSRKAWSVFGLPRSTLSLESGFPATFKRTTVANLILI